MQTDAREREGSAKNGVFAVVGVRVARGKGEWLRGIGY